MPGNVTNRSLPIITGRPDTDPLVSMDHDSISIDEGEVTDNNALINQNYEDTGRRLPDSSPEAPVKNRPIPIK